MVRIPLLLWLISISVSSTRQPTSPVNDRWKLVWSDEFNKDGAPDPNNWSFENGFIRNKEDQWYQSDNAICKNGFLIITAKREHRPNPNFDPNSNDWRKNRKNIEYTSSCLITQNLHSWQYGRFEMRAKIDVSNGLWPAWWMLGVSGDWPANGEIDMMEYYRGKLLANIACANLNNTPRWFTNSKNVDAEWASKFHTWTMDWDSAKIQLFADDILLNEVPLDSLYNRDQGRFNPFRQKAYMLLNLAVGGTNGGNPSMTKFPRQYLIDYVRVYQKE